jgi:putative membrane protein
MTQSMPSSVSRPRPGQSPAAEELLREAVPVGAPQAPRTGPAQGIPPYALDLLDEAMPVSPPPEDADEDSPWAEQLARPHSLMSTLLNVLFALAMVLALIVATQAVLLFNQVALLPAVARPFGYTLLAILAAVLAWCGLRFTWRYLRLRVSPTLDINLARDLRRLDEARREMRGHRAAQAREILAGLLDEYPVERPRDIRELRQVGFTRVEIETIGGARFHLGGRGAPADDPEWLAMYESDFLATLDAVADRQVKQYYTRVLAFTAASPRGGLDTAIVLWCSYQMVSDLCRIYNVRAGRWGTAVILGHLVANVLAARGVHSAADSAAGSLSDAAHQHLSQTAAAAAGIAAKLIGRVAEGGVNCLLMYRLSVLARDYLRPIRRRIAPEEAAARQEATVGT